MRCCGLHFVQKIPPTTVAHPWIDTPANILLNYFHYETYPAYTRCAARSWQLCFCSTIKPTPSPLGKVAFTVSSNDYFGNWMKDQWPLAIAVPAVLILGGAALSMKK